jgi:hypothetical protein
MQLPLYGIEITDLRKIWQEKGQFVPLEETYVLHIALQLEALGLKKGDPRYDWPVALAQTKIARDATTGLYKGDLWEINIDLAKDYAKTRANSPTSSKETTVYAARLGGDEFGYIVVRGKDISVYVADFANLSGLNPALSSQQEIESAQEEKRLNPRRNTDVERRTQPLAPHSPAGYERADAYLKTMVQLFAVIMAQPALPRETAEQTAQLNLDAFYDLQRDFNEKTELNLIRRLKQDTPETIQGTGLAAATQILDGTTMLNPPEWWEARIKEEKTNCQTVVKKGVPSPLERISDVARFTAILEAVREEWNLDAATAQNTQTEVSPDPITLHQVISPLAMQDTATSEHDARFRAEVPIRDATVYAIWSEILKCEENAPPHNEGSFDFRVGKLCKTMAAFLSETLGKAKNLLEKTLPVQHPDALDPLQVFLDALTSHRGEEYPHKLSPNARTTYKSIVNDIFNNYLNGAARVLHLTQDIQSAANTRDGHLALLNIGNFAGMNDAYTHKGCDAINSELLEIARKSLDAQMAVLNAASNPARACYFEEYTKAGERAKEDAGITGYILHGLQGTEADTFVENAKNAVLDYIRQHHLDKLPNPKVGVAGIYVHTSVTPIPPHCTSKEEAQALLAAHHALLSAQKQLRVQSSEHQPLETQQSQWAEHCAAAQEIVAQLIAKHEDDPLAEAIEIIDSLINNPSRAFACPLACTLPEPKIAENTIQDEYAAYVIKAAGLGGR